MASIITLDQQEFGALMFLFGIREIPGFPELQVPASGEEAEAAARSLIEKGYVAEGRKNPRSPWNWLPCSVSLGSRMEGSRS